MKDKDDDKLETIKLEEVKCIQMCEPPIKRIS
jgi:hypothetical protein